VLVDTGGLNLLTPKAAARLGLEPEGRMAARGTGEQQVDVGMAHGALLAVGAVRLRDPVFYVMDLAELPDVEGEDFDGLVGFELFHRFVVRIDYPARRLTLLDPTGFAAPAAATAIPFELHGRMPVIEGAIDGVAARFTVDTGARSSLTTHGPFTREHQLVDRYHPPFETVTGWGVGGPARGMPVRFLEVRLGPLLLRDVAGSLFTGDKGSLADPDHSANLGGGILRRFAVRARFRQDPPGTRVAFTVERDGDRLELTAVLAELLP